MVGRPARPVGPLRVWFGRQGDTRVTRPYAQEGALWGSPGKATPHVRYPGWVLDLAGTIAYMSPNTFGYLNRSPNTLSVFKMF